MKHDSGQENIKSRPAASKRSTSLQTGGAAGGGIPLMAPPSHPSRVAQTQALSSGASVTNSNAVSQGGSKRPTPLVSTNNTAPPIAPGSMSGRAAAPPLSPAASTFANLRKSGKK